MGKWSDGHPAVYELGSRKQEEHKGIENCISGSSWQMGIVFLFDHKQIELQIDFIPFKLETVYDLQNRSGIVPLFNYMP